MKKVLMMGMVWTLSAVASDGTYVGKRVNHDKTAQNFNSCPAHFYQGVAPALVGTKGTKLAKKSRELCFDGFAVLHSGVSRTPIWSAEHLTKARLKDARTLVREDNFHAESRVPERERAELSDYSRSGFDRGHLAPNGDMATKSQQFDSFSLANIAPQNGTHNRSIWRDIESSTRHLTNKYGETYVVTGVLFLGKNIQSIGTGVLVPSHFFKAVYIPKINKASVYYSANSENGATQILSLSQFTEQTGISPMPSLPADIQQTVFELPTSAEDTNSELPPKKKTSNDDDEAQGWATLLMALLQFLVNLFR